MLIRKNANPAAIKDGGKLVWKLGSFAPEQSKQITVSGMATNTDCVKTCATTTYVVPACASVEVVQPKLQLKKTAPAEACLFNRFPVKFVVTNTGTGPARDVKIEDTLPAGLRTAKGQSKLVFNAGTLTTGQSRKFSATLEASKTGEYVSKAVASSASGLKAESETTTIVSQAVLTIGVTGPEKRFAGRPVEYEITVNNKGDAPAKNLVVEDQLPLYTKFSSASDSGEVVAWAGKVRWDLGTLMPDSSRKVSMTVIPNRPGTTFTNTVKATATCAEGVRASVKTTVAGIPAVLLEVIDVDDPVELGGQMRRKISNTYHQGAQPKEQLKAILSHLRLYVNLLRKLRQHGELL
jgi:uncharacterized repeat protein (TIGR01451 family)